MYACNSLALDQLLSLRDGEPTDARVAAHVEHCSHCSQELARLRTLKSALRVLPSLTPPDYNGAELRARLRASRTYKVAGIATVLSVGALTLLLIAAVTNTGSKHRDTEAINSSEQTASDPNSGESVNSLVIRSQELESRLQRLPHRPQVQRAGTSATIDSLETHIQWVDYQLSLASDVGMTERQSAQLWENRIQLMDSLVKVRYAEAQRSNVQFASAAYDPATNGGR